MSLQTTTTSVVGIGGGSPAVNGNSASSLYGAYGATPIVQPTNAAQAALTLTTGVSGAFGFTTSAAFNAMTAQLENIRASLVLLGFLKGS